MSSRRGTPFSVDTSPTKVAIVDSLTRDITIEACVFDLIDNSIDAARDSILAKNSEASEINLPDSYSGFSIDLSFQSEGFSIIDNCGGISVEDLKGMVLKFGQRSNHPLGIGIFGLGLNRALFKLGNVSHLHTDTGTQSAELVLDATSYLASDDWDLPATEFRSSGKVGTSIEVSQLSEEIARTFADDDWVTAYRLDVGRRYGRFIRKGLNITVNSIAVEDREVQIRSNGPFSEDYKFYKIDDVAIHIRAGQHKLHRFSAEPDHEKSQNSVLTAQYGWTILCNDRAILMSDKTWKTGWITKFHTEFYGFVGTVDFVGTDPARLPWDTTKSDVDMNNRAYQAALVDMRKFAEKWRSNANLAKAKQRKRDQLLPPPSAPPTLPPDGSAKAPPSDDNRDSNSRKKTTTKIKKPTIKEDHNQFATVLPQDIDEHHCDDKHLALVHEGKQLSLTEFPYSGMALIRCLFEASAVTFFSRHDKLDQVKQFVVEARVKKGLKIPDEKQVVPDMDELIAYMEQNPDIWGAVKSSHLRQTLRKMGSRKKVLNGVLHNPFQPINKSEAFAIRDEVLAILRHLIES
ncbi:ATP-binding protein [Achromobacter kerstersii]|uniref:ATP-binding protein n=1 Tax=Achromobacter kerstersii TaxID=1353890 RepID=UPI00313D6244